MRVQIAAGLAVLSCLMAAPVIAQSGQRQANPPAECQRDDRACLERQNRQQGQQGQRPGPQQTQSQAQPRPQRQSQPQSQSRAPAIGESGRGGQRFERAGNSRFQAPPSGQDYRVVDRHLVLVDSNTLRIVSVLGLVSALLN